MPDPVERSAISPRCAARRTAMLNAARTLFLDHGFERTSLSDVVALSKGSRSSLYEFFGDKQGLLHAVLREATDRVLRIFPRTVDPDADVRHTLSRFGFEFISALLEPETIAMVRILHGEGHRCPDLARRFMASGPDVGRRILADYLRQALPHIADPEHMARLFLALIQGHYVLLAHIGLQDDIRMDELHRHVDAAVDVFLGGIDRESQRSPRPSNRR